MIKKELLLLFSLFSISMIICKEPINEELSTIYIVFSNEGIKVPENGPTISGNAVLIEKPGIYFISGESDEGNIIIKSSSVKIYLKNLNLSSKTNAPIIITSNLNNVKIINLQNTTLNDLEDALTTEGECSVVKIKKKSTVYFSNNDIFNFYGICKNIISGGSNASIIFEKSDGEYIINANKTAISSDGLLEFNGGEFTIISKYGDAIKSLPGKSDNESLGKILINNGIFNIHCYNDAIAAKNNITIVKGKFEIKTENGYDSITFDENESSKGFKLTNNDTGCGITVYSGDFSLNTADDAFHSKGDITIIAGTYLIYSKDDGISAKLNLVLGKKDAPSDELNLKILSSYEALEGMTVTIYSGKINVKAKDDGINASGVHVERNRSWPRDWNDTNRPHRRNRSRDDQGGHGGMNGNRPQRMRGNSSFYISIYGGEIYVFCDGDGIDSNGNIFIHGGDINVFSQGNRDNEPIDHDGNFTLFNGDVLGVGSRGIEYIHAGIKKGNQMYAYYAGDITKNKILEIKNENNEVVKEGEITKDINYIFYSSSKLNENYHFYIYDEENDGKKELNMTFQIPTVGNDDDDKMNDENTKKNDEEDKKNSDENNKNSKGKTDESNFSKNVKSTIKFIALFLLF